MRVLTWIFTVALFVVALGFAVANYEIAVLRFPLVAEEIRLPLVVFLLGFFAAGVVIGLLMGIPSYFRLRREISRLRKEIKLANRPGSPMVDPLADVAIPPARLGG